MHLHYQSFFHMQRWIWIYQTEYKSNMNIFDLYKNATFIYYFLCPHVRVIFEFIVTTSIKMLQLWWSLQCKKRICFVRIAIVSLSHNLSPRTRMWFVGTPWWMSHPVVCMKCAQMCENYTCVSKNYVHECITVVPTWELEFRGKENICTANWSCRHIDTKHAMIIK